MVVVVVLVEERTQWNKHKMIKLEIRVKGKTNQWTTVSSYQILPGLKYRLDRMLHLLETKTIQPNSVIKEKG